MQASKLTILRMHRPPRPLLRHPGGSPGLQPLRPPLVQTTQPTPQVALAAPSEKDIQTERHELLRLLRLSPTLTTVVSHDPSLLSNQDYVAATTPSSPRFLPPTRRLAATPTSFSSLICTARTATPTRPWSAPCGRSFRSRATTATISAGF